MTVSTMTAEERVACALGLQEPDRVPLFDLLDNQAVYEHYAGIKLTLENRAEVVPLAVSRALDLTRVWLPQAPGRRVDERGFVYERVDWFNEWQVDTPFHTLAELVAFVRRDIERLDATPAPDPQEHLARLLMWKERYRGAVLPASGAGPALAHAWIPLGLDWYITLEAEEPDLVQRWLAALHGHTMRRLQSEIEPRRISPVAWTDGDLAYKGRLLFSPAYLHAHGVFRHMAEICDLYHSRGLRVVYHSDGYIRPMIPDLIAAGVDAITPIEIGAGLDLAELKAAFGDRLGFVGGLDLEILRFGSVDDVRRATLRALAQAGPGGGFILGSSSEELVECLPAENIIAMWETTRECGRYPLGRYFPKTFDWR